MITPPFLSKPPSNILVRMPNWLGDFVMATPILTDLRHHWPEAKITAMCQGALSTVIQEDPNITSRLSFVRPKNIFDRKGIANLLGQLKKEPFDLGILLTNSFSSAYWFWKGGVQHRVGYQTHGRTFLLNHGFPFPKEKEQQHLVVTYKMLLEPLGIPVSNTPPSLVITDEEKNRVGLQCDQMGVQADDFIIGINPGAAYGSAKCWLPERFKQLTKKLLEKKTIKIFYFGDKAGAPLVKEICNQMPADRVFDLAGKTSLRELMAYLQACKLFLTNDSGPMHVASALGVPLVALFGSTSDTTTGPYLGGKVIHKHVPCSPCFRRECPIDFRCMKKIETQEVYNLITQLIN